MRAAAVRMLAKDFLDTIPANEILAPRGVALHLPPTNVDTIFVYSWALSALAGNANLVRLPAALSTHAQSLVRVVSQVLAEAGQAERHLLCTYDYGGETEREICRHVDLRIIWGGDVKVETVSQIPIRPDGLTIGFPDRQSLALIGAAAYRSADAEARDDLAMRLFNDAYWFDQMGCSSPRLLVWLGDEGECRDDLYARLEVVIRQKNYSADPAVGMAKFGLANDFLAEGVAASAHRYSNELQVAEVAEPEAALQRTTGGGFFGDSQIQSLDEVRNFVSRKVQTITHFGFGRDDLVGLARSVAGLGGYRIVPVGEALQFETTWDGVPLLSHMTRRIVVRA
ncbi:MAG TPA: acyl-CoA reductase [Sphingomicrobium sp.]|nr:acyl-CoA reductase [Sphingomicrobium sp.]